jgi:surface antigen
MARKKKEWIAVFSLLILFSGGTVSAAGSFEVVPCGAILASYKGVPARSNQNYPYGSCGGRSAYGLRYQCVEYVRRFYHLVKGMETREGMTEKRWDNANTFFKSAAEKGLNAFENGGPVPPLPDDILVFQGGPYGHVAIVTAVDHDHLEVIEQNFSSTGTDRLAYDPVTHRVADRISPEGKMILQGWLRPR